MKYNQLSPHYFNQRQTSRNYHNDPYPNSFQDSFEVSSQLNTDRDENQQEIKFLKDKLLETHQKFLRQLQNNQLLEQKYGNIDRQNIELRQTISGLKAELATFERIEKEHHMVVAQYQSKYRSVENKYNEKQKKIENLSSELEGMRNKMLSVLTQKNQIEESLKGIQNKERDRIERLLQDVRVKDDEINHLNREVEVIRKSNNQHKNQIQKYDEEIHRLKSFLSSKTANQSQLDHHYRLEKQKNGQLLQEIMAIQSEHKISLNRNLELEDQCRSLKDQIYWLQANKDESYKKLNEEIEKLTSQLHTVNSLYKQKQRQLDMFKKKPVEEAHRKRKHYQNTKQFVRNLQSEQTQRAHHRKKDAQLTTNPITHINNQFSRSASKSPSHNSKPKSPTKTYDTKSKKMALINQVGDLENSLLNCNLERRKIINEIDRIDDTKVKTKDIIGKRRKLEQQLTYQDSKIMKIKAELKKMKVM